MITSEQIGARLCETLRHSTMTQTELAARLGITQSTVAHCLRGDTVPSLETFANLCAVLDADPAYILCLQGN